MFVNVKFKVIWQLKKFKEYKVTKCKKVLNSDTSSLLTYSQRGYFIKGKYYKKKDLNRFLEKIPLTENLPF